MKRIWVALSYPENDGQEVGWSKWVGWRGMCVWDSGLEVVALGSAGVWEVEEQSWRRLGLGCEGSPAQGLQFQVLL